mmetsp:Transcript_10963/g.16109  ORF Transcript_10963/g.16109 Transcript_10963/m.16109 type:complete len:158 (+) Transcript_10963:2278-2751(+)
MKINKGRDQDNDEDIFSLYIVVIPFFIQMVLKNEILIASCSKEFEYNQSTHTNHPDILDKLRQYETDKVQVIKDVHMVDDDNEDDEEIKVESQESIFDEILLNPNEKPSIKIEQNVKTFWNLCLLITMLRLNKRYFPHNLLITVNPKEWKMINKTKN